MTEVMRRPARRIATLLLAATAATAWISGASAQAPYPQREVPGFQPVTEATLNAPPPGDWLSWRRTRDGQGYSPLGQINAKTVGQLRLAWSIGLSTSTSEMTPLVHDGVLYLATPGGMLQAIDGVSGDVIWQYQHKDAQGQPVKGNAPRNLAIFGDKLFLQAPDALVGVEAKTGKEAWVTPRQFTNSSGPMIADGVIIQGTDNCQFYKEQPCYVGGYDPQTGKELWRTYTIAQPGDPNAASWGDVPPNMRAGGDTWIPGSYDPKLKSYYLGVAQAKPWAAVSRGLTTKDGALYTASSLALDPHTGKIKWFYQHVPGESLDMDVAFERVLTEVDGRPVVITAGKDGLLWKLDRRTGAYIDVTETVHQDMFSKVDRATGKVTYRPDIADAKLGVPIPYCPGYLGGHNWQASAFSPARDLLFLPLLQTCATVTPVAVEQKAGGGGYGVEKDYAKSQRLMPGTDGKEGRLDAWDVRSFKLRWSHTQRVAFTSAAVATAGGLVFIGDADRYLKAFDADTGKVVWQTRLPMPVYGYPITYSAGGKQYLAALSAPTGAFSSPTNVLPEVYRPVGAAALYVFELPGKLQNRTTRVR